MKLSRVLVFAAHPDDETIGVGGTICRLHKEGATVRVIVFSAGGGGVPSGKEEIYDEESVESIRVDELDKVSKLLGFEYRVLGVKEVINRRSIIKKLVSEIRDFKPNLVFTHSPNDSHHLHRAVSECTTEACWHSMTRAYGYLGEPWRVDAVFFYEVFDLLPNPTLLVDVTSTFDMKLRAIGLYSSQIEVFPGIIGYVKALAQVRGFFIDTSYAEAFTQSSNPIIWRDRCEVYPRQEVCTYV